MKIQRVALIGGTGFVGRHLAAHLHNRGYHCRIVTRHPQRHRGLQTTGELVAADPFDSTELARVLRGCDAVVNLVGILNEAGRQRTFRHVHVDLVDRILAACHGAQVHRLLHMSALNANQASGSSLYLRTKGEGENRAHTLGKPEIAVTSFRPSVIFGPDDSFLNRFAALLRIPGPLPLACPDAQLAPVFIDDVVEAFANALADSDTIGHHYELCGPRAYTLKELVDFVAEHTGRRKWIIGLPDWASRMQATVLQFVPGKPFTPDNYLSLQTPSLCRQNGLSLLGVEPTSLESAGPRCLGGDERNRRLQRIRRYSGR
jgi:NADH dehydrogenase